MLDGAKLDDLSQKEVEALARSLSLAVTRSIPFKRKPKLKIVIYG